MATIKEIYELIKLKEDCIILHPSLSNDISEIIDWGIYNGQGLAFYKGNDVNKVLMWKDSLKGLIITSLKFKEKLKSGPFLLVENPQLAFIYAVSLIRKAPKASIHPTVIIDPEAELGSNISIGAYTVIGKCKIGSNSKLGTHVTISDNVEIGTNFVAMNACIIGEATLGSQIDYDGNNISFPHLGKLIIGNDVVMGPNVIVNRGALSDTIIGNNTHLATNSYVAHNAVLGYNVYISPFALIAASVKIGDRSYIGFGAMLAAGIQIEEGVSVGLGAIVTKSCLQKNATLAADTKVRNLGNLFSMKRGK